jgi:hypothetical protein
VRQEQCRNRVLKSVESILNKQVSTHTLDIHFPEIACLVMSLAKKEFRKISTSLRRTPEYRLNSMP